MRNRFEQVGTLGSFATCCFGIDVDGEIWMPGYKRFECKCGANMEQVQGTLWDDIKKYKCTVCDKVCFKWEVIK